MQRLVNEFLRIWVRVSLRFYFGKIRVIGRHLIPLHQPLIIVANHQNALLDALLVATELGLKPYYLARASIFKRPWIAFLLHMLHLMPVFRIRDGFQNLPRNEATFRRCQDLLASGNAILLFPEGNHSLKRYLRPLSKGFTRIAFSTLQRHPDLPLSILPVGINYSAHQHPGTNVSLHVGNIIPVAETAFDATWLKERVSNALRTLTVQLPAEDYDSSLQELLQARVDLSEPAALDRGLNLSARQPFLGRWLVHWLYFPIFLIWKSLKPRIQDPVFYGTVKFLIGFLGVPLYFLLIVLTCWIIGSPVLGLLVVISLVVVLYFSRHSHRQA